KFRYFIEQEKTTENTEGTEKDSQSKFIPGRKISSPEDIYVLDPAKGSGHILVYAFEVLYEIYRSQGYLESEIAPLILNKNLYGLEIDDRAAQLAGFALMMKARMYDKELFSKKISLNLCAIQETREECVLNRGKYPELCRLWDFFIDAKNYGSILKVEGFDFERLRVETEVLKKEGTLDFAFVGSKLEELVKQARLMSRKYDCVVTNPPYMGSKGMNSELQQFAQINYPNCKSDLFAMFIKRNIDFTLPNGNLGFMTPFVWMFISSYEKLRNYLINHKTIVSLIQLEYSGFDGATVPICAFTLKNIHHPNFKGAYIRLSDFRGATNQGPKTLEAIKNPDCGWFYRISAANFKKIPGSPIAYWVSERVREIYEKGSNIMKVTQPRHGMSTGNNDLYLRRWYEVNVESTGFRISSRQESYDSNKKWFPVTKGGEFRKWYGNNDYVINYKHNGKDMIQANKDGINPGFRHDNPSFYFRPGITWSTISSSSLSMRYFDEGFIIESKGSACYSDDTNKLMEMLGYTNSKLVKMFLLTLSPTLDFHEGPLGRVPVFLQSAFNIQDTVEKCVKLVRKDWDSYETSWDFTTLPLLQSEYRHTTFQETYTKLREHWREITIEMQRLEEENNRIFIEAYGLQDELTPDVPLSEITLTCNPHSRYNVNKTEEELEALLLTDTIKEFISYA
ncbi:BREX-1 system adenine-specific DNA-methyltransferase PglX, partial [bacterium]|nr:BREX-1 system adenine-specific DNA-methyltransferase PglX [bacterium]